MQIYLPIAEMSVSIFLLLGMGAGVGFLSGMFGVGGGFLMTPLLIFAGVPPAVAVGTQSNQIIASSVTGVMAHWRRGNVDFQMGFLLLGGGAAGAFIGVFVFKWLRSLGQVDLLISLSYVIFLGIVGGLMLVESFNTLRKTRAGTPPKQNRRRRDWVHTWPLKMRFRKSRLYISAIPPVMLGVGVGILSAIMGVGGGFIMVPAMIYILGMPTNVVIGTSLFQIIFVAAIAGLLHAGTNQTVDVVLALLLVVGAVIGAQFGTRVGLRMKAEQLRALLALLVVVVCFKLGLDLVLTPADLFSLAVIQ
ncbi:MAG: sulfite exporter TauE/SafE family protein [Alphaproteobacteria bacterium]